MSEMDYKDRAHFERGKAHGIAMAMLSAGIDQLVVDEKHALWSYTHQMRVNLGADGKRAYSIFQNSVGPR